jgi:hypothetical protein
MFSHIDLLTSDGRIRQVWSKFIRTIQTELEHKRVTNGTVLAMTRGQVVYATAGNRQVALALATNDAPGDISGEAVGVMTEPTPAATQGVMRYQGYAYVRFEAGLVLVGGTAVYVSETEAGSATNVVPPNVRRIGTIADGTGYGVANPFAWVWLGRTCAPVDTQA